MCTTCGCEHDEVKLDGHPHHGHHAHDHAHDYGHAWKPAAGQRPAARRLSVEQDILARNDAYATQNRRLFEERGIFALNLVSSPGSGKTTLLVKTIECLRDTLPVMVIEGDQQTNVDAERIRATGISAVQINTGKGCHLDAHMVGHAVAKLAPPEDALLFIENVGNLVCPSAFDLGEAHKVVVLSVTEGEDKPLKYPDMFRAADLMLINKSDLLPYVQFSTDKAIEYARRIHPTIDAMIVSATSGEGMEEWIAWIEQGALAARNKKLATVQALRRRIQELETQLTAASQATRA